MNRRSQRPTSRTSAVRVRTPAKKAGGSRGAAKAEQPKVRREDVLSLIRARPGIRPSELNRLLNLKQSDSLRSTLIRAGLIRKEKDGAVTRYYPVKW
jgi:hypothetical protein